MQLAGAGAQLRCCAAPSAETARESPWVPMRRSGIVELEISLWHSMTLVPAALRVLDVQVACIDRV